MCIKKINKKIWIDPIRSDYFSDRPRWISENKTFFVSRSWEHRHGSQSMFCSTQGIIKNRDKLSSFAVFYKSCTLCSTCSYNLFQILNGHYTNFILIKNLTLCKLMLIQYKAKIVKIFLDIAIFKSCCMADRCGF